VTSLLLTRKTKTNDREKIDSEANDDDVRWAASSQQWHIVPLRPSKQQYASLGPERGPGVLFHQSKSERARVNTNYDSRRFRQSCCCCGGDDEYGDDEDERVEDLPLLRKSVDEPPAAREKHVVVWYCRL